MASKRKSANILGTGLQAAGSLSLAAAKPLSPNDLSQSFTPATDGDSDHDDKAQKSDADAHDEHIKVICRFRPPNSRELAEEKRQNLGSSHSEKHAISIYNDSKSVSVPRGNRPAIDFTLDTVLWHTHSQAEAFASCARKTVDDVVEGYNATIFAFGQTGSGKTYTIS